MGNDDVEKRDEEDEQEQLMRIVTEPAKGKSVEELLVVEPEWKQRGVVRSFGLLIYEQKHRWFLYLSFILACALAGGKSSARLGPMRPCFAPLLTHFIAMFPLQAYIFGQLIGIFTLTGSELVRRGNFWALMFFVLALAVFLAYFIVAWVGHVISCVRSPLYYSVKTYGSLTLSGNQCLLSTRIPAKHSQEKDCVVRQRRLVARYLDEFVVHRCDTTTGVSGSKHGICSHCRF